MFQGGFQRVGKGRVHCHLRHAIRFQSSGSRHVNYDELGSFGPLLCGFQLTLMPLNLCFQTLYDLGWVPIFALDTVSGVYLF